MADKPRSKDAPNYRDFLPEAQAISERRHSPLASVLVMVIGGFFLAILLWAGLAEVDQSVVAPGEVRPGGRVKVVNHPEGGAVAEVLVRDGDLVTEGQALLVLDDQLIRAEVRRLNGDLLTLEADLARLEAEAGGNASIDFPSNVISARPDLVATHSRLFEARRDALAAQRESADREIEQAQSEINSLRVRIQTLRSSADVLREQVASLQTLTDKGHFPFLRFQSVQRQLNETEGELQQTQQSLDSATSGLSAARSRRREIDDTARSGVLTQLAEVRGARDRTAAALAQAQTRLDRTVVRSPVDGYVQNLAVNNPGQAVRPNEPLMSVVPEAENLIIEARVANKDISAVEVGQDASVKVRAYDFIKYGTLDGKVVRVARDANRDEQTGQVFFRVDIQTDKAYLGEQPGQNEVRPGMEVDAELKAGSRSVLSFLTDRVIGTSDEAFRQR
ncbi:HlyD family type I secretion periplasmic adaptor subunit [Minwuia sp.]|uniref:HlyD family type I secretion periplasmic adaptor subunit n=1 Tax=Minwuia sp. TaxID=2493630 RepID=UPI003A8C9A94